MMMGWEIMEDNIPLHFDSTSTVCGIGYPNQITVYISGIAKEMARFTMRLEFGGRLVCYDSGGTIGAKRAKMRVPYLERSGKDEWGMHCFMWTEAMIAKVPEVSMDEHGMRHAADGAVAAFSNAVL
jgi:hypothetical protein